MININNLTEADKGREVVFERSGEERDYGHISSWNDYYVFVKYRGNNQSHATRPEDIRFALSAEGKKE